MLRYPSRPRLKYLVKAIALSLLVLIVGVSCTPNEVPSSHYSGQVRNDNSPPSYTPTLPETLPDLPNEEFTTKSVVKKGWYLLNNRWVYYAGIVARDAFREHFMVYIPEMGWKWGPAGCELYAFVGC